MPDSGLLYRRRHLGVCVPGFRTEVFRGPGEKGALLFRGFCVWYITAALLGILAFMLKAWVRKDERVARVESTWGFMKQIFPLLIGGVLVAGFMLGRPEHPALIPEQYVQSLLGENSIWANLFASVAGTLMYFTTLTEISILQGLIGSGMGKGPALALLLAGAALSLPNMVVIGSVMGVKKTTTFCGIIVVMSTIAGLIYGSFAG